MRTSVSLVILSAAGLAVSALACGSSSAAKGASAGTGAGGAATTVGASSGTSPASSSGTLAGGSGGGATSGASGTSSSSGDIAPAGGHDGGCAPSETAPAPAGKFPFPPVATFGDPVIQAPRIVSVVFSNETDPSSIAAFGDGLASTCYWDVIRAGYCDSGSTTKCIGDGPAGVTVGLTTKPAASYTDPSKGGGTLQTFLEGLIKAGTVPAPSDDTLYQIYFPASVTIEMDGSKSCDAFDGYHSSMVVGSQTVYYAVIPECAAPQMTPQITTLQNTTITASHEAIEAATDGDVAGEGGYYLDVEHSEATYGWDDVQGGEVADLCVDPFLLGLDEYAENGFTVQRIWSLANAAAGKNPCVPIPAGEVYFNTYPDTTTLVMDVGTSQTITVHALADGAMPAWTLLPQDWTDDTGNTTYLSFSFGDAGSTTTQVSSGDSLSLTVTLTADPSATQYQEADGVLVSANATNPNDVTAAHFWPFVVLTPATAANDGITQMRGVPHRRARSVHRRRHYRNVFGGLRW